MAYRLRSARRPCPTARQWRKRVVGTGLAALALAAPSAAYPYSLEQQLLRLPLECLLQLEISPRRVSRADAHSLGTPGSSAVDGGCHVA
ncbi:MAG: hypothetical protein OEM00_07845 [Burkholderiaceae bacterium]|nr:hypothetical protein [Burkholderiaceae bacterium]